MSIDTLLENIAKCFLGKETLDLPNDAKQFTLVSMQNKNFDKWNEDVLFCGVKIGTIKHERTSSDINGTISISLGVRFEPVYSFMAQWLLYLSTPIPKYPLSSYRIEVPACISDKLKEFNGGDMYAILNNGMLAKLPASTKVFPVIQDHTPPTYKMKLSLSRMMTIDEQIRADYHSLIAEHSRQAQPLRVHRRCRTCDELRDDCTCKNKTL